MTVINVIRYPDGRTIYPCGVSPFPPTNPKLGQSQGNTVTWNENTRVKTVIVPRQNPVNLDAWAPKSNIRYTGPTTYAKPTRVAVASPAAGRTAPASSPCPPKVGPELCGK
jgi:hypothetical protein